MSLLQNMIKEASQKYYSGEDSGVSDSEFDNMMDQLKEEEPDSRLLNQVGHGYDVNNDSTPGEKVTHRYGCAGSLRKCHNWKELDSELKYLQYLCASLKLDGLSVVLYYTDGVLAQALTRGDGEIGIDITDKVRYFSPSYQKLNDSSFTGAVRGEIVMSFDNFSKFKQYHEDAKNPRNSTAGLINGKEIVEDLLNLDIVVYTIVGIHRMDNVISTYDSMIKWLEDNFDKVVSNSEIQLYQDSFEETMSYLKNLWYGVYPGDGNVVTSPELSFLPGRNKSDTYVAYHADAFKFKAESAITEVINIEWNLSKTKYLIPRIQFKTVELSGTNVSWCSGNNAENIKKLRLGPGAEIEVLKSGEIIPYLERVITPVITDGTLVPEICPCCGSDLVWNGVHLMCPNRECSDSDIQDLLVWMENIAPYDGLGDILKLGFLNEMFHGEPTIEKIYERGNPKYSDPTPKAQVRMFREMYSQLFTNKVKLCDAIRALNIPRLGEVTSKKLAQYPEYVRYFVDMKEDSYSEEFLEGFDKKIGAANFESIKKHIHKFKRLLYIQHNIDWLGESNSEEHSHVKVAITGKLSVKRSVFETELKEAGFISGNISKDTAFLITDNPNSTSDKNKKADQWGITKITEQEFRNTVLKQYKK